MFNPVFIRLEKLFAEVQNGDFDDSPYGLAVEIETLANLAWEEVEELIDLLEPLVKLESQN